MKHSFGQRILCILLSACLMVGLFVSLEGTYEAKAEKHEFTYKDEETGADVKVWVSETNEVECASSPFGYSTRGGYVKVKIDTTGGGKEHDEKWFWLSSGGPLGDGTVLSSWAEYEAAGAGKEYAGDDKKGAYGDVDTSMFWFSEKDFDFNGSDSVAGNLIEEYLLAYMEEYFNYVYAVNFDEEEGVHCDVVWGNAVQVVNRI